MSLTAKSISALFKAEELHFVVTIFCFAVPCQCLLTITIEVFRGFHRVWEKVVFENILSNLLKIICLGLLVVLGFGFKAIIYGYVVAVILNALLLFMHGLRTLPKLIPAKKYITARMDLLIFSFPLLIVGILGMVMGWTDTMMLGYFMNPEWVGVYNTAHPLANFLELGLTSLVFIYTPVVSMLYSEENIAGMKALYVTVTRWMFTLTLPLCLSFVLFPGEILTLAFGQNYQVGAIALRILAVGQFINILVGPNGATLIVLGKTKLLMFDNVTTAVINVVLNILLIPRWGIAGAAMATSISLVIANGLRSFQVFYYTGIHIFKRGYVVPLVIAAPIISVCYILVKTHTQVSFAAIILFCTVVLVTSIMAIVMTGQMGNEDKKILLAMQRRQDSV
jgi:O-antigen/teichoic acid export membrane protein